MVRLKVISKDAKVIARIIFQFLMVRLKEKNYCNFLSVFVISIPYGAIKSKLCRNYK